MTKCIHFKINERPEITNTNETITSIMVIVLTVVVIKSWQLNVLKFNSYTRLIHTTQYRKWSRNCWCVVFSVPNEIFCIFETFLIFSFLIDNSSRIPLHETEIRKKRARTLRKYVLFVLPVNTFINSNRSKQQQTIY